MQLRTRGRLRRERGQAVSRVATRILVSLRGSEDRDGNGLSPDGREAKQLWRLPASAILAKLYIQCLSIADNLDARDAGLEKQSQHISVSQPQRSIATSN